MILYVKGIDYTTGVRLDVNMSGMAVRYFKGLH